MRYCSPPLSDPLGPLHLTPAGGVQALRSIGGRLSARHCSSAPVGRACLAVVHVPKRFRISLNVAADHLCSSGFAFRVLLQNLPCPCYTR